MKALHKLILKTFFGPFVITFSVLVFIFLMQNMLKYIDDFVGKGVDMFTFAELFFYFSFNVMPRALPLAVMLSALMTYGNLGQHNELTAIKSSGISLVSILTPVFIAVIFLSVGSFLFNDYVLPKMNIKAYSLLYDIRHKKPALDIREKIFYNGLPGYSLRVGKKHEDGKTLGKLMIYDHGNGKGNTSVIVADSGYMHMINEENYLVFELFNGKRSAEHYEEGQIVSDDFIRSDFDKSKMVFDMTSFKLQRTPEDLFSKNKLMLRVHEIDIFQDSIRRHREDEIEYLRKGFNTYYRFGIYDTAFVEREYTSTDTTIMSLTRDQINIVNSIALQQAKNVHNYIESKKNMFMYLDRDIVTFGIEKLQRYTNAVACLLMFMIGAPIGAILKKGGIGIPALLTLAFFILYYVISINAEKYAKMHQIDYYTGTWLANILLLPFGLYFLLKAKQDASLFEFSWVEPLKIKVMKLFKKD